MCYNLSRGAEVVFQNVLANDFPGVKFDLKRPHLLADADLAAAFAAAQELEWVCVAFDAAAVIRRHLNDHEGLADALQLLKFLHFFGLLTRAAHFKPDIMRYGDTCMIRADTCRYIQIHADTCRYMQIL